MDTMAVKEQICDVCHKMWQLGWVAANDVLALNKAEHSAIITLPEDIFTDKEVTVETDEGTETKTIQVVDLDYVADQLRAMGDFIQTHTGRTLSEDALRAANDVRFTMVVSVLSMAIWRLGFSYLLGVRMGYGAIGVWIAMVVDWICRSICFVWRFKSGVWKTKYHA